MSDEFPIKYIFKLLLYFSEDNNESDNGPFLEKSVDSYPNSGNSSPVDKKLSDMYVTWCVSCDIIRFWGFLMCFIHFAAKSQITGELLGKVALRSPLVMLKVR